jgi:hypothetical protein
MDAVFFNLVSNQQVTDLRFGLVLLVAIWDYRYSSSGEEADGQRLRGALHCICHPPDTSDVPDIPALDPDIHTAFQVECSVFLSLC